MRILLLGDVCGPAGMKIIQWKNLMKLIKEKKIDFTIANGENAADSGKGITKNFKDLINSGVDVITSGNHIWDQKEILEIIDKEKIDKTSQFIRRSTWEWFWNL